MELGKYMYQLAEELFPICRSITGDGVKTTLGIIKREVPDLDIKEVACGTEAFDWSVPDEWNIRDAYVENSEGSRVIDFKKNNLHVVGYSEPVDKYVGLEELKKYLYTIPEQPDVIPYMTSYYKRRYGFCLSENEKKNLKEDTYHMVIDSDLNPNGVLNYGEIIIKGELEQEIFLSTYICHPSMANNELSGPCVVTALIKWLQSLEKRKYTYRIVFIPETIGSIVYLSRHYKEMKKNIIAGFNVTCVGDDRTYSYIQTRYGNTLSDKVAMNVLHYTYPQYRLYTFLDRGSDERQYNAPGIELPVGSICRSKYEEYPEYHTSADNMSLISEMGLEGAYEVYRQCLEALENNEVYQVTCLCEPQLGKRGLYPTIREKSSYNEVVPMMNFIAYADGTNDLIDISNIIGVSIKDIIPIVEKLYQHKVIIKREDNL